MKLKLILALEVLVAAVGIFAFCVIVEALEQFIVSTVTILTGN